MENQNFNFRAYLLPRLPEEQPLLLKINRFFGLIENYSKLIELSNLMIYGCIILMDENLYVMKIQGFIIFL